MAKETKSTMTTVDLAKLERQSMTSTGHVLVTAAVLAQLVACARALRAVSPLLETIGCDLEIVCAQPDCGCPTCVAVWQALHALAGLVDTRAGGEADGC